MVRAPQLVILAAAALAAAPARAEPPRFALSTTAAAARIALPLESGLTVSFSPFTGALEVRRPDGTPLRASTLAGLEATPCTRPKGAKEVLLTCSTGRLDAELVEEKGRLWLDIRQLRGLPTDPGEEGPPPSVYPPEEVGLGAACPGDTAAGRGECAWQAGKFDVAERQLTSALQFETERRFAAMRLGDLWLKRGEPDKALGWWQRAAGSGPWGRLANVRICETTGGCYHLVTLEEYEAFGLPSRLRVEMELRELRALTILRRWNEVALMLPLLFGGSACSSPEAPLCRHVLLTLLRAPGASRELALEAYMKLPARMRGHLALPLAVAAADAAAAVGAPSFGASLLSTTMRMVRPDELPDHLRHAIDLYAQAGDPVRARVVAEFAETRFPKLAPWTVPPPPGEPVPPFTTSGEVEPAEAALAVAQSALLRAQDTSKALAKVAKKGRR